MASTEFSVGAIDDEDDLDFWSCLKNISKNESGKIFESSKAVFGVFDLLEMLGSLYEHFASVVILVVSSLRAGVVRYSSRMFFL